MNVDYEAITKQFSSLKNSVILPIFQRNIVWSINQKKDFINTLMAGYPFGSLLLYEENNKHLLVDGFQRYSTLREFSENPLLFLEVESICKIELEELIKFLKEKSGISNSYNYLRKMICNSIKENLDFKKTNFSIENVIKPLSTLNEGFEQNMEFYTKIFAIAQNISNKVCINNLFIPVIIYYGDFNKLPYIFEKINSKGTKLNKYQMYAAKWNDCKLQIDDNELLKIVDEKYEEIIETSGMDIYSYKSGSIVENKEITLFEYCFSIGKLLKSQCEFIFGNITKPSEVDSIGFILLSLILNNSLKKMDTLNIFFQLSTSKELVDLKSKLLLCSQEVEKYLKQYIEKNYFKYIEYQVAFIIATLFKIRYIKDNTILKFNIRENCRKDTEKFKKYMPQTYLYDIISDYWSGNGDLKVNTEIDKSLSNNRLLTAIDNITWEGLLSKWMEDQIKKPMKNIVREQRLFINYMIKSKMLKSKCFEENLEIEYIISKEKLIRKIIPTEGISAIGNLYILLYPSKKQKVKSTKTLYEQIDEGCIPSETEKLFDDFFYPNRDELNFIYSPDSFTHEKYIKFLKYRHPFIINKFIELLV